MAKGTFHLMLSVGNACNLSCRHCYREESGTLLDELDRSELEDLLFQQTVVCGEWDLVGLVTFSGGEPLMRRDLEDLIRVARAFHLIPRVLTNGVLLTPERVKSLKDAGVGLVQVSLDGATPETHDAIRGKGRFQATVRGLERLVEAGVPCNVKVTLMPGVNTHEIDAMFELASRIGVPVLSAGRLIPQGSGRSLMASVSQLELTEQVVEAARRSPFTRLELREPTYDRSYLYPGSEEDYTAPPEWMISVDADGTIYPNRRVPSALGNVRSLSLRGAVEHPLLVAWRRGEWQGACKGCDLAPVCGGGSRADAMGLAGDPLAADPSCWYSGQRL